MGHESRGYRIWRRSSRVFVIEEGVEVDGFEGRVTTDVRAI